MFTHYLPTLNLSVDNALSVQQQIHQLITMLNKISDYLNNLDKELDSRIDVLIKKQLVDLKVIIDNEIKKALEEGKEYTNFKANEIYDKLAKINAQIEILREEIIKVDEKADRTLKHVDREISLLEDKMNQMLRESVSVVSPYTGATVSVQEGLFDAKRCAQELWGMTIQDIFYLLYTQEFTNVISGVWQNNITTVEEATYKMDSTDITNMFGYEYKGEIEQMPLTWRNLEYFTRQVALFMRKKFISVSTGEYVFGRISYTLGQTLGVDSEFKADYLVAFPNWTTISNCIDKEQLTLAKQLGLLDEKYKIKESGQYPL